MRTLLLIVLCSFTFIYSGLSQNVGDRIIQRGQAGYSPPAKTREAGEPEPPDVNILSQERADMYQQILEVDDFQKEVLKTFLKDYYSKSSGIAFNKDLKFDAKQKLINAEKKLLEKSLLDVFTAEQVEIVMNEEQFGSKTREFKKEKKKEKRRQRKEKKNNG